LAYIPCPCCRHKNYAQHYIQPFLDSIKELGIHCEVLWTHEQYELGRFAEVIDMAIRKKDEVARILKEVSGRDVPPDFFPYSPRCQCCGRLTHARAIGYEYPFVSYQCACGHHGRSDIRRADGKMPWRIEWAAKWKVFNVTCEPFGKDHAAAGGSYDTGVRLAKEIFEIDPPYPVPYEFVQLKGKGQMHKSTGSTVTGVDALRITPAAVMNYIVLRVNPSAISTTMPEWASWTWWMNTTGWRMYYSGICEERDRTCSAPTRCLSPRHPARAFPCRSLIDILCPWSR
jgi:lysyl-tRNA synthetase class 1